MEEGANTAGGVLLRVAGRLFYVAATHALKLAPIPTITRVPGAPESLLGVALHEGEVLPVMSIGSERESMLVCVHGGARLGVVGGTVVATGMFEVGADGMVLHADEVATPLDVPDLCSKASPAAWGGRWLT